MSVDDKLTTILVQIGETRGKVNSICEDLIYVKNRIHNLVSKDDCVITRTLENASYNKTIIEIREELSKQCSDLKDTAYNQKNSRTVTYNNPSDISQILAERAEGKRKIIAWYLGTSTIIVGLISTCGITTYKVSVAVDNMRSVIQQQPILVKNEVERATYRILSNSDFTVAPKTAGTLREELNSEKEKKINKKLLNHIRKLPTSKKVTQTKATRSSTTEQKNIK